MNGDCLLICGTGKPGHHRAQIAGIREIDLADLLARAGTHQVDGLHEILIILHVLFALVPWKIKGHAADDGKMPALSIGAVEYDAVRVDQIEFVAAAGESDG